MVKKVPVLLFFSLFIVNSAIGQKEMTGAELKTAVNKIITSLEKGEGCGKCKLTIKDCVRCIEEDSNKCEECPNCNNGLLNIWAGSGLNYKKKYSILNEIINPSNKIKEKRKELGCYRICILYVDSSGKKRPFPVILID